MLLAHGQLIFCYFFTLIEKMRKTPMTRPPSRTAIQLLPLLHFSTIGATTCTGQHDYVRCDRWEEKSTPDVSSAGGGTFVRKWKNIADARRNGRQARRTYISRCDWDETSGIPSLILYVIQNHKRSPKIPCLVGQLPFNQLFFHAHYRLGQIPSI